MTKDKILQIARSRGSDGFNVSMRYRDERLLSSCQRLVREGKLVGGRRQHNIYVFYYVKDQPKNVRHPEPLCNGTDHTRPASGAGEPLVNSNDPVDCNSVVNAAA